MMRIARYVGPRQLVVDTAPQAKMNDAHAVRVRSLYSAISHGTEMSVFRGQAPFFRKKYDQESRLFVEAESQDSWTYPISSNDAGVWYLGYSLVGEVTEVGADVGRVSVGDLVYINASHQSEHVVSESAVHKLPNGVAPISGVVTTNLLTAFNGILDADIKLGDHVVVMGLGVIGQLVSQLSILSGAIVHCVDIQPNRLAVASNYGASSVLNPTDFDDLALAIRKMTNGRGPDVVIDATGSSVALNEAIRIAAPERSVVAISWFQGETKLNLTDEFHHNRIKLICSQANHTRPDIAQLWPHERKLDFCSRLLEKIQLERILDTVIPFERIQEAYDLVDGSPESVIQVVMKY